MITAPWSGPAPRQDELDATGLTFQQIRFFRDVGYLRFPQRFGSADIQRMLRVCDAAFDDATPPVRRDEEGRVVRLSRAFERDPLFREVYTSPLILGPLSSLLGPNIEFASNRHNHVTLDGARTSAARFHRDVLQWSRPIVSVLVYLDDANERNGCTHVIPSSHLLPYVGTPNNGGTWMDEHHVFADLLDQAVPVPMATGGILAFSGLAFHAAAAGTGRGRRRAALSGAYHSVDELKGAPSDDRSVLVLGSRIYRGSS